MTTRQTSAGAQSSSGTSESSRAFGLIVEVAPADTRSKSLKNTIDVTSHVTSISMNLSLTQPWESCDLTLAIPGTRGFANRAVFRDPTVLPGPGDWVVIRARYNRSIEAPENSKYGGTPRAVFFGYVTDVSASASVDPATGTKNFRTVKVTATSWFDAVARNQVYVAPQAARTVGTFFAKSRSTDDLYSRGVQALARRLGKDIGLRVAGASVPEQLRTWDELIDAITASLKSTESTEVIGEKSIAAQSDAVGKSLEKAWVALGTLRVPALLASQTVVYASGQTGVRGQYLADQVPVVYNEISRQQYAPRMTVEAVPGWSLEGLKSIFPQGQSTIDLIMGAYMADQNMVELYPTLEPYDAAVVSRSPQTTAATIKYLDRQAQGEIRQTLSSSVGGALDLTDALSRAAKGVGGALGNLQALVDETKGKKTEPGTPASDLANTLGMNPVIVYRVKPWRAVELTEYAKSPTVAGLSLRGSTIAIDDFIFRGKTWHRKTEEGRIVHGFRFREGEITNWTGSFNEQDHVNCVSVGLPNQPNSAIQFLSRAGLPLLATAAVEEAGLRHYNPRWPFFPPLQEKKPGVNVRQAALLESLYTVALQAMQFMGNADRFLRGTVGLARFTPDIRPGMTADFEVSDIFAVANNTLSAYVESVSHTINVNPETGEISSSTSITYSRGALSDDVYLTQFQQRVPQSGRSSTKRQPAPKQPAER